MKTVQCQFTEKQVELIEKVKKILAGQFPGIPTNKGLCEYATMQFCENIIKEVEDESD